MQYTESYTGCRAIYSPPRLYELPSRSGPPDIFLPVKFPARLIGEVRLVVTSSNPMMQSLYVCRGEAGLTGGGGQQMWVGR
jgi:hypothetical protein